MWPTHAVHVPPGPAAKSMDCVQPGAGRGGADRSQISRKTISIDLAKLVETEATLFTTLAIYGSSIGL